MYIADALSSIIYYFDAICDASVHYVAIPNIGTAKQYTSFSNKFSLIYKYLYMRTMKKNSTSSASGKAKSKQTKQMDVFDELEQANINAMTVGKPKKVEEQHGFMREFADAMLDD